MAPYDQLSNNIPNDIIFDILLKVPIESLCRFKSASRNWRSLINAVLKEKLIFSSQKFPFSSYTLDFQSPDDFVEIQSFTTCDLKIVGSCHGLVLLRSSYINRNNDFYYLWNPLTRDNRQIKTPDKSLNKTVVIEGLAYDTSRDKFKLVIGLEDSTDWTCVLTTSNFASDRSYWKTASNRSYRKAASNRSYWKRVGDFRYQKYLDGQAVVLNGSPHWIVKCNEVDKLLVYFDPHNDELEELPVPVMNPSSCLSSLTILGKNLCWVTYFADNYQFLVLKESTWCKLFVMPSWPGENIVHAFMPSASCTSVDGEEDKLINAVVCHSDSHALAFYNVKEKKRSGRQLKLPRHCSMFNPFHYEETFASP